jgi:hypothetical protein
MTNTTNQSTTKKYTKLPTLTKLQILYNIGKIDYRYNRIHITKLLRLEHQLNYFLINNQSVKNQTQSIKNYCSENDLELDYYI